MGRRPGSKNKPKDQANGETPKKRGRKPKENGVAADAMSAGPGHNKPDLNEDEKQALFLQQIVRSERRHRTIADLKAEIATVVADERNDRKSAKKWGFTKEMIDHALYLRKVDPEQAKEKQRSEAQVAKWLAHPLGFQFDMFSSVDRTPSVERAYAEGKAAGLAGAACELPSKWQPNTEQGQAWFNGYGDGQAILLSDGIKLLQESAAGDFEAKADPLPEGVTRGGEGTGSYTFQ